MFDTALSAFEPAPEDAGASTDSAASPVRVCLDLPIHGDCRDPGDENDFRS